MFASIEAFHDGLRETKKMVICWLGFPKAWLVFAKGIVGVFKMFLKMFFDDRSKSFIIVLSKLMDRKLVVCKGALSGSMSIQRTATFQTCGIKPNFSDMVKARAKTPAIVYIDLITISLADTAVVVDMKIANEKCAPLRKAVNLFPPPPPLSSGTLVKL